MHLLCEADLVHVHALIMFELDFRYFQKIFVVESENFNIGLKFATISILSIVYTIERKHATVTLNLRLLPDAKSYPVQHHFSSILRRFTP